MSLENCTGYPEMPKDSSECVKLLRQFNEWRRWIGAAPLDEEGPAMPHPKSIGFAIDMAIHLIEQYGKLLAEFGAYKEGSEEAFGVLVEQKKSAESRLAQMQQTISIQQSVICNMREKLGVKGGVL